MPTSTNSFQDYSCVDQRYKDAGVAALPIIVAQCNALISLVDQDYFSRAWCVVEVYMMHKLLPYRRHALYKHTLQNPGTDRITGYLSESDPAFEPDIAKLGVTYESDRPKVDFLLRQSKLLGKSAR